MYGMEKTTVYLPDYLKQRLARAAAVEGTSEAALIRDAISARVAGVAARAPRLPQVETGFGDPTAAGRADDLLAERGPGPE